MITPQKLHETIHEFIQSVIAGENLGGEGLQWFKQAFDYCKTIAHRMNGCGTDDAREADSLMPFYNLIAYAIQDRIQSRRCCEVDSAEGKTQEEEEFNSRKADKIITEEENELAMKLSDATYDGDCYSFDYFSYQ